MASRRVTQYGPGAPCGDLVAGGASVWPLLVPVQTSGSITCRHTSRHEPTAATYYRASSGSKRTSPWSGHSIT